MTDSRFSDAYKRSVNSTQLPENFKDDILSNLILDRKVAPLESAKKGKGQTKFLSAAVISAAAAVVIIACAVLLFSVFRNQPRLHTKDMTFKISSATNLAQIGGAKVNFKTPQGEYLTDKKGDKLTVYTNEKGEVTAAVPKVENLQIEVSAEGFIPFEGNVYDNIYLSPEMTEDTFRAVLTWSGDCDLDAVLTHTTEEKTEKLHYFNSDILNDKGNVIAALDTDSEVPHAPETITFNPEGNGVWRLSVGSYSSLKEENSLPLQQSGAKLILYKGSSLVEEYTIDTLSKGNVWRVLEIENGEIKVLNETCSVSAMTDIN